jgi:HAD superfamily hydrolase (TIGR01484 family)
LPESDRVKPLSDLDSRGLRGILCDIDDTLTHEGALVPAAYQAIVDAKQAGLHVVPVTGRPAGWAEVLAAMWPVDAVVAENGAVAIVRHAARTLEQRFWDDEPTRKRQRDQLAAIREDVLRLPFARIAGDNWLRLCDLAFDIGETQQLSRAQVEEISDKIQAHGGRVLTSTVHAHAYFGNHDKAAMLVRLARELFGADLDREREKWLFVGDSPNDQAGFSWFPVSVGVANVKRFVDRLNPPPTYVTTLEGGHGFAELVETILRNR